MSRDSVRVLVAIDDPELGDDGEVITRRYEADRAELDHADYPLDVIERAIDRLSAEVVDVWGARHE